MKNTMILFLILNGFLITGCSGFGMKMKSLVSGKPVEKLKSSSAGVAGSRVQSFNQNPNMPYRVPRRYKRMTKSKMEQEAKLDDSSGSLWVNEGQTSYLFSQNQVRRNGDILNIMLDGAPLRGLETKASVIKKMLSRLERRNSRRLASARAKAAGADDKAEKKESEESSANPAARSGKKEKSSLEVEMVPTRIVERMVDGNYRVKGAQPFMIGKREFKVIAAGIVRGEDFNDEGISASKLLDPKFDIVSIRGVNR